MNPQTAIRKNIDALPAPTGDVPADSLARWLEAYLGQAVSSTSWTAELGTQVSPQAAITFRT